MTKRKTTSKAPSLSEVMLEPSNDHSNGCSTCKLGDKILDELKKTGEMMAKGESKWSWGRLHRGMRQVYPERYMLKDYRALKRHFADCWTSLFDDIEARR